MATQQHVSARPEEGYHNHWHIHHNMMHKSMQATPSSHHGKHYLLNKNIAEVHSIIEFKICLEIIVYSPSLPPSLPLSLSLSLSLSATFVQSYRQLVGIINFIQVSHILMISHLRVRKQVTTRSNHGSKMVLGVIENSTLLAGQESHSPCQV